MVYNMFTNFYILVYLCCNNFIVMDSVHRLQYTYIYLLEVYNVTNDSR